MSGKAVLNEKPQFIVLISGPFLAFGPDFQTTAEFTLEFEELELEGVCSI